VIDRAESERVRERYARRSAMTDLYSVHRDEVFWRMQELDRVLLHTLQQAELTQFAELRLLEIGCGTGDNLLRFLRWGFHSHNILGNELLSERAARARERLPASTGVLVGDALDLEVDVTFDIVHQSTVFSSILDDDFQVQLANKMWQLTRPGGAVLSYDFAFSNPSNPDVRKVTVNRLRELFPDGVVSSRRVTLAPPLARRVARQRFVYAALAAVPSLRTHRVVLIRKPRES
jgi:SAM-dependent methyltransferase